MSSSILKIVLRKQLNNDRLFAKINVKLLGMATNAKFVIRIFDEQIFEFSMSGQLWRNLYLDV